MEMWKNVSNSSPSLTLTSFFSILSYCICHVPFQNSSEWLQTFLRDYHTIWAAVYPRHLKMPKKCFVWSILLIKWGQKYSILPPSSWNRQIWKRGKTTDLFLFTLKKQSNTHYLKNWIWFMGLFSLPEFLLTLGSGGLKIHLHFTVYIQPLSVSTCHKQFAVLL